MPDVTKEAECKCEVHVFNNEDTMRIHALEYALKKDTGYTEPEPTADAIVKDAETFLKFPTGK